MRQLSENKRLYHRLILNKLPRYINGLEGLAEVERIAEDSIKMAFRLMGD